MRYFGIKENGDLASLGEHPDFQSAAQSADEHNEPTEEEVLCDDQEPTILAVIDESELKSLVQKIEEHAAPTDVFSFNTNMALAGHYGNFPSVEEAVEHAEKEVKQGADNHLILDTDLVREWPKIYRDEVKPDASKS